MKFDGRRTEQRRRGRRPDGYQQAVVISWGDPICRRRPEVRRAQRRPAPRSVGSSASTTTSRGCCRSTGNRTDFLLVTNHEYVDPLFMFPGYNDDAPTREQFDIEIAALGMAVVEVERAPAAD